MTSKTREQYNIFVCYLAYDDGGTKVLSEFVCSGEGALILSLTNNTHFDFGKKKICNILIKAKPGELDRRQYLVDSCLVDSE